MDVPRHDADLDFFRRDEARAVGTQQQGFLATSRLTRTHAVAHFQHVAHRNALGNADRQIKFGFHRLPDGSGRTGWGHINHGYGRTRLGCCLLDRGKNGNIENRLPRLFGVYARDKTVLAVGVFLALFGVKLPGLAGNALRDDFGVLIDKN